MATAASFPATCLAVLALYDEGRYLAAQAPLIDDANGVSYPDCLATATDGRIYIAYDQSRYGPKVKDILLTLSVKRNPCRRNRFC